MAIISPLPYQDLMSYSSSYSVEPIVRTLNFGDGYVQRSPLGARPTRVTATVTYSNIPQYIATDILHILEGAYITGEVFTIGYNDLFSATNTYDIVSWDVSASDPNTQTITVNLMQVWDY